jgi:para-nitrobenzyl esterase
MSVLQILLKRFTLLIVSGVTLTLVGSPLVAADSVRPEVSISSGQLRGTLEEGVRAFKGIPYAAPPVGDLRWRAPQAAANWSGVRDAADYGPICPQQRSRNRDQDEDCLTLNVWAPAEIKAPLPVMVWIHGGAHVNGSGRTGGETFASNGVVLVSINYRLGRFGVFNHPELATGEPSVNFAVLDQVAALRWVAREIQAFGGDPRRVTIFGVSAGGSYVNLLMVSPLAAGLFHRAIAQSGANGLGPLRSADVVAGFGERLAANKGVKGLAGLRGLPWQDIVDADAAYRVESSPVVDGVVIPESVSDAFARGHQHNVPYIAGANSYEGSLAAAIPIPAYQRIMQENIERVEAAYGMAADDPLLPLLFYGDMLFVAPSRHLAKQMQTVSAPSWLYHFDYVLEATAPYSPGARHGGEVAYVFDRLRPVEIGPVVADRFNVPAGTYGVSERDLQVAKMLQQYWIGFARAGSPAVAGQPVWPAYEPEGDVALVISNEGVQAQSGVRRAQLDLIENGYRGGF